MAALSSWSAGRLRFTTRLIVAIGLVSVLAGGSLVGMVMSASAATPTVTLAIKSSVAGTCNGSLCKGLANGDVINVSGAGFDRESGSINPRVQ